MDRGGGDVGRPSDICCGAHLGWTLRRTCAGRAPAPASRGASSIHPTDHFRARENRWTTTLLLRALADALSLGLSERLIGTISKRSRPPDSTAAPRLLLVGLQNPRCENTRHNAGQMLLTQLVEAAGAQFGEFYSCDGARVAEGKLGGQDVLACMPNSFMNLSGRCVGRLSRRYTLGPSQVVVFHDDLDLAVGRCKIKQGGSSGGHRGVDSCAASLQSHDFWRVRIGIGRPADKAAVPDFVLQPFAPAEHATLSAAFERWGAHCDELPAALAEPAALSRLLNAVGAPTATGAAVRKGVSPAASASAALEGSGSGGGSRDRARAKVSRTQEDRPATAAVDAAAAVGSCKTQATATPDSHLHRGADSQEQHREAIGSATEPTVAARAQSWGATSLQAALPSADSEKKPAAATPATPATSQHGQRAAGSEEAE